MIQPLGTYRGRVEATPERAPAEASSARPECDTDDRWMIDLTRLRPTKASGLSVLEG
jgi:hypothetical protein